MFQFAVKNFFGAQISIKLYFPFNMYIAFHQLCTTSILEAESYLFEVPLSLSLLSAPFLSFLFFPSYHTDHSV